MKTKKEYINKVVNKKWEELTNEKERKIYKEFHPEYKTKKDRAKDRRDNIFITALVILTSPILIPVFIFCSIYIAVREVNKSLKVW